MIDWRNSRGWLLAGLVSSAFAAVVTACGGGGGMSSGTGTYNPGSPMGSAPPPSLSKVYAVTNLVSDTTAIAAAHHDPNLVNGWGVAFNPNAYAWVANNGTSTSTLYDGNGVPQSLVVSVPATKDANPTGIVFNGTQDFKVGSGTAAAPALFLFVGEAGTLSGWSPTVNDTASVTVYDGSASGKVYKALAIGNFSNANYLYAADFADNKVDVFDGSFTLATLPGGFVDPTLPAGYGPFGIQAIGNLIYVAYARHQATGIDEQAGAGLGVVAVFDMGGRFLKELTSGGALNAPWGMAMAPAGFGAFGNSLLVGNFGDGKINAYDPGTGAMLGTLSDASGAPLVIDGLWGLVVPPEAGGFHATQLVFSAGPAGESHGRFGTLDAL